MLTGFNETHPNQKVCSGGAETICLINQEARSAAFLGVNVKYFLKKGGEKNKNGISEAA